MRPRRRLCVALVVLVALAVVGMLRRAEADDPASGAALFDRGLAEMQAGRYETGCPALAESHRLDPRPGVLFTLAECEAAWNKIASAVAHYDDYLRLFAKMSPAQQQAQRSREAAAREKRDLLSKRVPKLALELPASAPPGTVVRRDGVVLGAPSLGQPLPVDPGPHVITTQAPSGPPHEERVTIGPGETQRLVVTVVVPSSPARDASPPAAPAHDAPASLRPWAVVAGAVGLTGIAVGSVTGIMTFASKDEIEHNCVDTVCNAEGKKKADEARAMGWVSTTAFGVGLAGLVVATALLIAEPNRTPATAARVAKGIDVTVAPADRSMGLGLRGVW